ncbi:MAG: GNVR domain-containing protein [Pleurocapsa sp. MO_226.B13]|nr:GNVR domain-containing protein [Pleurocapsa sp. MO_226.B13]
MNQYIMIAGKHWKLLTIFNISLLLLTAYIFGSARRTWTAKSKLILPNPTSDLNANLGTLGNISSGEGAVFSQQLNSLKILASIITSKDGLREVWKQDSEKELYPRLAAYENLFTVSPQNESTIIEIEAEGSSPEIAKQRTENLISTFQNRLKQLRTEEAAQRVEFLHQELEKARQNLQYAEITLNNYKSSASLVNNDLQTQETLSAIKTLSTQRSQVIAQVKASETKVKELSTRLNMNPAQGLQSLRLGENSEYLSLQQELSRIETALTKARAQFFDNSPQVEYLLGEREKLSNRLQKYGGQSLAIQTNPNKTASGDSSNLIQELILADSEAKESRQKANQLQQEIEQLNQELKLLPGKQRKLLELQRQYETAKGVHNGLMAQIQKSKLNVFSAYPNIQVLDVPDVDSKPTKPKKKLMALGYLLTSISINSAIILFLDKRQSLLNIKEIQSLDFPVLANIPELKNPQVDIRRNERVIVEFQRLASAVSLMKLRQNRLMITSTTAGEGKSTILLGLAYGLVDLGFKVLIIDGDYRSARLSQRLGYFEETELPFVSSKPISLEEKLDLFPAFPQTGNIAEFVARGTFGHQLEEIQNEMNYDYVLVDSPAIGLTSEAAMMAKEVSNLLFVVKPGLTNADDFYHSVKQIANHQGGIIGLVVNGINDKAKSYLRYQSKIYLSESLEQ